MEKGKASCLRNVVKSRWKKTMQNQIGWLSERERKNDEFHAKLSTLIMEPPQTSTTKAKKTSRRIG